MLAPNPEEAPVTSTIMRISALWKIRRTDSCHHGMGMNGSCCYEHLLAVDSVCMTDQEGRQQRYGTAGRAFGSTALPGSARDIKMGPGVFAREAFEEAGCCHTAGWSSADVG